MRQKLLARLDTPVFIGRPLLQLFDAVDPSGDFGEGFASYSLKLERRCFWRQVSREDRKGVDYASNTSNDKMKWRMFDPDALITWTNIPVTRNTGRTSAIASFDIAVPVEKKTCVFRNQTIMVGASRDDISRQARAYLDKTLGLKTVRTDDAVIIRSQGGQFTGALLYSYLADLVAEPGEDVQILDDSAFEKLRQKEDSF